MTRRAVALALLLTACLPAYRPPAVQRHGGEVIPWGSVAYEYRTFARCMGWAETPPPRVTMWRLAPTAKTWPILGQYYAGALWVRGDLGTLELPVLRHEWVHAHAHDGDPEHRAPSWPRAVQCGAYPPP